MPRLPYQLTYPRVMCHNAYACKSPVHNSGNLVLTPSAGQKEWVGGTVNNHYNVIGVKGFTGFLTAWFSSKSVRQLRAGWAFVIDITSVLGGII